MEGIKVQISNNTIQVTQCPNLVTSGTIGLPVEFTFDDQWDNLSKLAVFKAGLVSKTIEITQDETIVPWEVLEIPNETLHIGVYGMNADCTLAIPTIFVSVCTIKQGTDPEIDPAMDPTLPVWQDLINRVEDLEESGGGGSGGGGKDGFSPIAEVEQTAEGATITITDKKGTTTATVYNGKDGEDYILTDADKKEIADSITPGQIGAATEEFVSGLADVVAGNVNVMDNHIADTENPHGITREQIGAAPSGFGLGDVEDSDVDDCNDLKQNGWFKVKSTALNCPVSLGGDCIIFVMGDGYTTHQLGISLNSTILRTRSYLADGVWTGWKEIIVDENIQDFLHGYVSLEELSRVEQMVTDVLTTLTEYYPTTEYMLSEIDNAKAVIVTVDGTTSSMSSQEITEAVKIGKAVYLEGFDGKYLVPQYIEPSKVTFEYPVATSIEALDGNSYAALNQRTVVIRDNTVAFGSTMLPSQDYIDARNPLVVTATGTTPSHTNAQIYEAAQNGRDIFLFLWGNTYLKATLIASTYAYFEGSYYSSAEVEGENYYCVKYRLFTIQNDKVKENTVNLPRLNDFVALKNQVAKYEKPYELIQSFMLEEDTKTVELSGFNLDKFVLYMTVPVYGTDGGCRVNIYKDEEQVFTHWVNGILDKDEVNTTGFYGKNENGLGFIEYAAGNNLGKNLVIIPQLISGMQAFTKIEFIMAACVFPTGTTFDLWGVKR